MLDISDASLNYLRISIVIIIIHCQTTSYWDLKTSNGREKREMELGVNSNLLSNLLRALIESLKGIK